MNRKKDETDITNYNVEDPKKLTAYSNMYELGNKSLKDILPVVLSTMMMVSEDKAYVKGKDLRYICCSRSAARSVGLENPNDIIGKSDFDLFDKELANKIKEIDQNIINTAQAIVNHIEKIYDDDLNVHLANTSKYPIIDAKGQVVGIYGLTRDVTQEKKDETQLEFLTRTIPGGIASFTFRNGSFKNVFYNEGFYKFSGYSREEYIELTSKNPLALMFEEDRYKIQQMLDKFRNTRRNEDIETCIYRCYTKNGGYRWMNMKCKLAEVSEEEYILNVIQVDITEQKRVEENLRVAEEEYRLAAMHSGRTLGRYNISDKTITIESNVANRLNLPDVIENVPYGRIADGKVSTDTAEAYKQFFEKIMNGEKEVDVVFQNLLPIGWRWLNAHASTIFSEDGKPVSAVVSYMDITKQYEKEAIFEKWQKSMENRSEDSYTLFRCDLSKDVSFESVSGSLIPVDKEICKNKSFDVCTEEYARHSVYEEDKDAYADTIKKDNLILSFYQGNCNFTLDYRESIGKNKVRWIRRKIDLFERPDSTGIMAYIMFEDIDKMKRNELTMQTRAETDPLTGLLNRNTFSEKMKQVSKKENEMYAFLLLDMDGFKQINDTFGHAAGDQFLIETGKAIQSVLRDEDLLGRLGGDEFIILLGNAHDKENIEKRTGMIWSILHRCVNNEVRISASIGIAISPNDGDDFDTLYHKADKALYKIKNSGKDNFEFYFDS